jgi:hypothetical protein
MQGLMGVVCVEGLQRESPFVWSRAFRAAPARTYLSNRKTPIHNSNWAQVTRTSLLREAEVYAAHNQRREATYI